MRRSCLQFLTSNIDGDKSRGPAKLAVMKRPRFSIASLLWLTAIVAVAAALPPTKIRTYVSVEDGPRVLHEEHNAPILVELSVRGIVVIALILIVWFGHIAVRTIAKRRATRPPI